MIRKQAKFILLGFFAMETACASYGLLFSHYIPLTGIIYFLAGLGIAVIALYFPQIKNKPGDDHFFRSWPFLIKVFGMLLMAFIMYAMGNYLFYTIPVDKDFADMLPIIKVMNERLLQGHPGQVYAPIAEIWNGTKPVYLPAMWLPYWPALLAHIDLRWTTLFALFLSFSAFLWTLQLKKNAFFGAGLFLIALMLFFWLITMDEAHNLITMSEEGVVIAYYVLLVFAIASGNIYFLAIAFSLCLFSRYAAIGWAPAFLFYLIRQKKTRQALIFLMIPVGFLIVFLILPFGSQVFIRLIRLPSDYISFAARVWHDNSAVFWLSPGFAKFFGPGGTAVLHVLLIVLSFSVPLTFMIFCCYIKKPLNNIPLATLKISVVIFYNFIDVPYLYLFYTSSFVSLIMAGFLIRSDQRPAETSH